METNTSNKNNNFVRVTVHNSSWRPPGGRQRNVPGSSSGRRHLRAPASGDLSWRLAAASCCVLLVLVTSTRAQPSPQSGKCDKKCLNVQKYFLMTKNIFNLAIPISTLCIVDDKSCDSWHQPIERKWSVETGHVNVSDLL